MLAINKAKDLFSVQIQVNNFGVESKSTLLLKAGVDKHCQIQTIFLGDQNNILSCISNNQRLKISLLTPEILKLHEFKFDLTNDDHNKNKVLGKVISTQQVDDDFILKIAIIIGTSLEIYKMRFAMDEGKKEFLLENKIQISQGPTQICLFSRKLIGLFYPKTLDIIDILSKEVILKKRVKGI